VRSVSPIASIFYDFSIEIIEVSHIKGGKIGQIMGIFYWYQCWPYNDRWKVSIVTFAITKIVRKTPLPQIRYPVIVKGVL
jgi:hypothetical protein